jgi:hypothetical protein
MHKGSDEGYLQFIYRQEYINIQIYFIFGKQKFLDIFIMMKFEDRKGSIDKIP